MILRALTLSLLSVLVLMGGCRDDNGTSAAPAEDSLIAMRGFNGTGVLEASLHAPRRHAPEPLVAIDETGAARITGGNYDARIADGRLELNLNMSLSGRAPSMSYRLGSVRAGTDVLYLDSGQPTPLVHERATRVVLDHGRVDEIYDAVKQGIKQSFRLDAAPAAGADLEIRGPLTTNLTAPADGASGRSLPLTQNGRAIMTISQCVAIDATGNRLDLDLTFESGDLVIRVPSAWLASATYPVLIDPVLGSAIPVDSGNGITFTGKPCDIAYNAVNNEYLIVWYETFGGTGSDVDIMGQRVDAATGALLGSIFFIEGSGVWSDVPAVAWNSGSNEYLVAYYDAGFLTGRIVPGGTSSPGSVIAIDSDLGGTISSDRPDVAATGSGWRVVWQVETYSGSTLTEVAIYGRDVVSSGGGAGATTGSSFVVQDVVSTFDIRPSIAYNSSSTNFFIAWDTNYSGTGEVFGRTASTATPPALGTVLSLSTSDGFGSGISGVAANLATSEYLAVWSDGAAADGFVAGRIITGAGALSGGVVTFGAATADYDLGAQCAWNSTNNMYVVTWHGGPVSGGSFTDTSILSQTYTPSMTLVESTTFAATAGLFELYPTVAARTTAAEACATWLTYNGATYGITAQRYTFPTPPTITSPTSPLPNGTVGVAYGPTTFTASGDTPITWSTSGTLPPGITMSAGGVYSGTPTTAGTYTFDVTATNIAGSDTVTYTHTIDPAVVTPPSITGPASLANGTVGVAYGPITFTATGTTPITWTTSGTLPPGLTLTSAGVYSGTPTTAGTYTFDVIATNTGGSDTATYTHTIDPAPPPPPVPPTITGPSSPLPDGTVGVAYGPITFTATGDTPITWTLGAGAPPGLTMTAAGVYSGTPTTAGTYTFDVTATNSAGSDTNSFTHTILAAPTPPTITGPASPLPDGTVGVAYPATTFTASGTTPITWSTGGTLPPGLSLSAAGVYSGTPTTAGTYTFTVTATNSAGSDTDTYTHTILPAPTPPTITGPASPLPAGTVGTPYGPTTFTATGTTPITWSFTGTLPPGMTLSAAGVYSGTPTTAGTYTFSVTATNAAGSDTDPYSHTIVLGGGGGGGGAPAGPVDRSREHDPFCNWSASTTVSSMWWLVCLLALGFLKRR